MKKPLILYFHDEKEMNQANNSEFLKTITKIASEISFPVTSIEQFRTILKYLDPLQEIYVFVHVMGDLRAQNPQKDYPGVGWAIAVEQQFKDCNYYYVTTNITKEADKIDGRPIYNFNTLFREAIKNKNPAFGAQTVKEILKKTDEKGNQYSKKDITDIDFVILTALYYDEMEQIKTAFKIKNSDRYNFGKNAGYHFVFKGYNIIAVSQSEMGMVDSAILASQCVLTFNPNYLIMPGVCGGDKKTNFGDVIIPNKIHLFQAGKLAEDGFEKEAVDVKIDSKLTERIKPEEKEILSEILKEIKQNTMLKEKFAVFLEQPISTRIAPMACSTMVIDKRDYFDLVIKEIDRKMVAVEMESYGVARAVEHFETRTKALLVKCVMDKTRKKKDLAKGYAAYISAQFVKKIIERKILD